MFKPYGNVEVLVTQPFAKFGKAVVFGIRNNDGLWVASVNEETHELDYAEAGHGVDYQPTLLLSEEEIHMLWSALSGQPVRTRGDGALDHLKDTITVRDRLLTMVEKQQDRSPVQTFFAETSNLGRAPEGS